MAQNEFVAKVNELKEMEIMMKELESVIESLKDELKDEMNSKGVNEMIAGNYIVRYKEVSSQRLDSKTLKQELPEVYVRYSKTVTAKRFTVA